VVAVKVRHPGVADTILRDFSTMMSLARLASMVESLSHLRLEETLSQFAAPLKEQVCVARMLWVLGSVTTSACHQAAGHGAVTLAHRPGCPMSSSCASAVLETIVPGTRVVHVTPPPHLPACRLTWPVRRPTCSASTTTSGTRPWSSSLCLCTHSSHQRWAGGSWGGVEGRDGAGGHWSCDEQDLNGI
jgi:hypothetical protein